MSICLRERLCLVARSACLRECQMWMFWWLGEGWSVLWGDMGELEQGVVGVVGREVRGLVGGRGGASCWGRPGGAGEEGWRWRRWVVEGWWRWWRRESGCSVEEVEGDHHRGSGFGARARLPEIRRRLGGKSFIFIIIGRIGKGFNVPMKEFIKNLKFNLTSTFQVSASFCWCFPIRLSASDFRC